MARTANFIMKLVDKVTGPASKIRRAVGQVPDAFRRANDKIMRHNERLKEQTRSTFMGIGDELRNALAVGGIAAFGVSVVQTTAQVEALDNAIRFGSGGEAQANFKLLNDTIQTLGLDAMSTKQGFSILAGSFKDTALQGQPMRELFTGVSSAVSALGISGEDAEGTFIALGQIMSKGKVQAEELRGQLGERIPGAFQIAARAMGMTTKELDKQLSLGNVMAEDFLPKFAKELQNTFGGAALQNANSLTARINRLQNAFTQFKMDVFAAFEPFINMLIAAGTYIFQNLGPGLGMIIEKVKQWGIVIATATAFLIAYKVAVMAINAATRAWAFVQALLNGTLAANPIGVVIGLIAALVAAVIYAYTQFDQFRGVVHGLWEALKETFSQVANFATAIKDIVVGTFTFDEDQIMRGVNAFQDTFKNSGQKIGQALVDGYNQGLAAKPELPDFLKGVTQMPGANAAGQAMALQELLADLQAKLTANASGAGSQAKAANTGGTTVEGDSGAARIVNVRIENINTNVAAVERGGGSLEDLADRVARVLVGAARDAEIVLSNG